MTLIQIVGIGIVAGPSIIVVLAWISDRIYRNIIYPMTSSDNVKDRWAEIRNKVLIKHGHRCSLCGKSGRPLHVHHVIPLSEGGSNDWNNLTVLCERCHEKQHNKKFNGRSYYDSDYGFHYVFKKTKVLQKAIENKRLVEISYKDFDGLETLRTIKPIKVFKEKGRYYVKAFCLLRNSERHFRLSRLRILRVLSLHN